jgi:hypothetical protein
VWNPAIAAGGAIVVLFGQDVGAGGLEVVDWACSAAASGWS